MKNDILSVMVFNAGVKIEHSFLDLIEKEGHLVSTPTSYEELLLNLFQANFDMLFIDTNLPGRDGVGLIRLINTIYPELRIVLLTKEDYRYDELISRTKNIFCTLISPFTRHDIQKILDHVLRRKKAYLRKSCKESNNELLNHPTNNRSAVRKLEKSL